MFRKQSANGDDQPVDPNERSPQLGLKWKDVQVLSELVKHGVDLLEPRHVIYFLYFPSREAASAALAEAGRTNMVGEISEPLDDHPDTWGLVLQGHEIVLAPDWVRQIDDELQALADKLGGEYDGWEAAL